MHPNRVFAWTDTDAMRAFVARVAFAHIFVATADGPAVGHAPVIVTEAGCLRFHLARGNRLVSAIDGAVAMASVAAHDHYVSPDWYASADQVPTWNYLAVEAEGPVARLHEAELALLLDALSEAHETRLLPKPPWTRAKMSAGRFDAMLGAIVGLELRPSELRGTIKLGQNKGSEDRAGVVAALQALGRADEAALVAGAGR